MGFNWNEFLNLACHLAGQTSIRYSEEAAKRTSVSRAYYAAFCSARNHAKINQGFKPGQAAEDHRRLREHFKNLGGIWVEVSEHLDDLRKWRNRCDYDDIVLGLDDLVLEAIPIAERVLSYCR
jgi:uncharacterized protein (UPF0332 family)